MKYSEQAVGLLNPNGYMFRYLGEDGASSPKNWEKMTKADDKLAKSREFDGDTLIAHLNPAEASLLAALGGAGTVNKKTGFLQFGWGGGGDNDSDSDTNGVDNGGDQGDRGFDAGSLGGDDRGGTDSSDASGEGDYGNDRGGRESSGSISGKFRDAYSAGPRVRAMGMTTAETAEGMSPFERQSYLSNVAGLNESPFSSLGGDMTKDNTPQSRAGSMFNQAKMKQIGDVIDLGQNVSTALGMYGYQPSTPTETPTKTDDLYDRYFNTDWSRFNLTNKMSKANAMSNDEFSSYVTKSPVAASLLGNLRDMELGGYSVDNMGVTSGNKGVHSPSSKHYSNSAVDTNTKANSASFNELSSRMANDGWSRGDKLGWGAGEKHHFQ